MHPEHADLNIQIITEAAERALQGDFSLARRMQELLTAHSRAASDLSGLAAAMTSLISTLQERDSLLQNHAEELRAQNDDLASALAESEARERELANLYQVAKAITSSLDQDELILILEESIRSLLDADTCSLMIHRHSGHGLEIIGPGLQMYRRTTVEQHADVCEAVAAQVATSGSPSFVNNVPNCQYCRYMDLKCNKGVHHMLSVPMRSHDRLVGAINAFRLDKQPFAAADERKLAIIAGAAAVALENAEAYRRERNIADKLQRGIQPDSTFELHGFSIGCDYLPASSEAKVGGDFYDVVDIGDGRVGIVMADISGKGVDAAVYTAMARFTLRGLMLAEPDPAVVLQQLNEAVCAFVPDDIFITLFYAVLDTRTCELEYANAGHDEPFLFRRRHGSSAACDVTGPALGMAEGELYSSRRAQLEPGDILVLFTDGITEARRGMEFYGPERVQQVISKHAGCSAPDLVSSIFSEVQAFAGGELRDDAGVLVIKVLSAPCEVDTSGAHR